MRKSQKNPFALPEADLAHVLRQAAGELEALRGKKLFLTGGTGFFGKWLVGALAHADAELSLGLQFTVLSRSPEKFLAAYPEAGGLPSLRLIAGHVHDFQLVEDHYDYILHAATDSVAIVKEEDRSRDIVAGTRRVLELAQKCGAARLLNVSSGAVYGAAAGKQTGAAEDDYTEAQPATPYAVAKREAERLCSESGIDFVTARAFAFLGPYLALDAHFAAGNFLRDTRAGGPVLVRGDGSALRSYLYPADLVVWLLRILVRGQRARAYNVGSDEFVTTAQLAREIAGAVQPAPEVIIQSLQPQGPQNVYLPDIRRARAELQLDVVIPLRDAIARTFAFFDESA